MGNVGTTREMVMDEAIAWHLGLEQAGADEWHRFVAWLEADPAHQDAYDRVTMDDAALSAAVIEPVTMAAPCGPVRVRRLWLRYGGVGGGLLAAAAAAWVALMPAAIQHADLLTVQTAPGEHRTMMLADGTRVDLNGGSRLQVDRAQPRSVTLEQGEAVFHVVHHADHPFEVRSGGVTLQDVGTVFNVARSGGQLRVAVAEGSVLYEPKHEAVSLTRGMALALRDGEDRLTLSHVDAGTVGGWAQGRLDFREVALATVAEDLGRSTGARLTVAPALAAKPFTGTLRLDRSPEAVVRSLAALAGGELRRDGRNWTMLPKTGGAS